MKLGEITGGYDCQLLEFKCIFKNRPIMSVDYLINGETKNIELENCMSLVKLEKAICAKENFDGNSLVNIINGEIINSMNDFINWLDNTDVEINNRLWYLNNSYFMVKDKDSKNEVSDIL